MIRAQNKEEAATFFFNSSLDSGYMGFESIVQVYHMTDLINLYRHSARNAISNADSNMSASHVCILLRLKLINIRALTSFVHFRIMRLAVTTFTNSNTGGYIDYFVIPGKR